MTLTNIPTSILWRRFFRATVGIVFLGWCGVIMPATADDSGDSRADGFYASAEGGYLNFGDYCGESEADCKDRELFYALRGGYQFNPYFSAEAAGMLAQGFEKKYDVTTPTDVLFDGKNTLSVVTRGDFHSYMLGGRLMLPVGDFSFFGKAGGYIWQLDSEGSRTKRSDGDLDIPVSAGSDIDGAGAYYGGGFQYTFESKLVLRTDYTYFDSHNVDTKKYSTIPQRMESFGASIMFYF